MNPYINTMAGFGAGFVAFFPVEASPAGGVAGTIIRSRSRFRMSMR